MHKLPLRAFFYHGSVAVRHWAGAGVDHCNAGAGRALHKVNCRCSPETGSYFIWSSVAREAFVQWLHERFRIANSRMLTRVTEVLVRSSMIQVAETSEMTTQLHQVPVNGLNYEEEAEEELDFEDAQTTVGSTNEIRKIALRKAVTTRTSTFFLLF